VWFITEVLPGLVIFLVLMFVVVQNVALRKRLKENQLKLDIEVPADALARMAQKINEAAKKAEENGS